MSVDSQTRNRTSRCESRNRWLYPNRSWNSWPVTSTQSKLIMPLAAVWPLITGRRPDEFVQVCESERLCLVPDRLSSRPSLCVSQYPTVPLPPPPDPLRLKENSRTVGNPEGLARPCSVPKMKFFRPERYEPWPDRSKYQPPGAAS